MKRFNVISFSSLIKERPFNIPFRFYLTFVKKAGPCIIIWTNPSSLYSRMRCVKFFWIGPVVLKNIIKIECILNVLLLFPYGKDMSVLFQQVIFKSTKAALWQSLWTKCLWYWRCLQINVFSIIHFNFYSTIFIEELHVYMLVDVSDLSDSNCNFLTNTVLQEVSTSSHMYSVCI